MADIATKQIEINLVLSEIASALVGQFEMSRLLDQVVNTSMRTLNAEVCSIFLEDKEKEPGVITMMAGSGFAKPLVGKAKYAIGEGFTGYVAKYGMRFNIKKRGELESLKIDGQPIWKGKHDDVQWPSRVSEFRNLIALPLKIKDQILGVIKVENKDARVGTSFTEDDEKYFETIANVVALAIENARLHERVEKQLKAIAAKASHRIGNELTNYDGIELDIVDEAARVVPDKQALYDIARRMAATTLSLKRMIGEFKNYGKPLRLDKYAVDMNEIIKNEAWHARPPEGIVIEKILQTPLPLVSIDASKFGEAFKELFGNSIRAIQGVRRHGKIVVQTSVTSDGMLLVAIYDDGPGFPSDFPVFEPFQTTNTNSTGLGLATVKELVEAHGGQIRSVPHCSLGGACVEFELPLM